MWQQCLGPWRLGKEKVVDAIDRRNRWANSHCVRDKGDKAQCKCPAEATEDGLGKKTHRQVEEKGEPGTRRNSERNGGIVFNVTIWRTDRRFFSPEKPSDELFPLLRLSNVGARRDQPSQAWVCAFSRPVH